MGGGDLETLCRSCGMCCDGSLFGRVDLRAEETQAARRRGLKVIASGDAFEQPCAALAHGRCSIYEERPEACRRFTCRLYERHEREGGPIEPRLAVVRRVRELVAGLEATGLAPSDLEASPAYQELTLLLTNDLARAR
jgi:Fe-S-cluster containining protein